jgi:Mg/Co/Ni transporter MgtE
MRSHGIRRLPIVDHNQMLIGIVTLDDLIDVIVGELGELSSTIASGQYKEALYRRASGA